MTLKTFCGCLSLKTGAIIIGSLTVVFSIAAITFSAVIIGMVFNHGYDSDHVYKISNTAALIYAITIGVTGALMIHGARKRDAGFIFPWLARATADLMIFSTLVFTYLVIGPIFFGLSYLIGLIIAAVLLALHTYVWLVIYSFHKQLTVAKLGCTGVCKEEKIQSEQLNIYHHI